MEKKYNYEMNRDMECHNIGREEINSYLKNEDKFFSEFILTDNDVYASNYISKSTKELLGLTISIISGCKECIAYHMQECLTKKLIRKRLWKH